MQADSRERLAALEADCVGLRELPVAIDQRVAQFDRETAASHSTLVGDKFLEGEKRRVGSRYLSPGRSRSRSPEGGETSAANPETETHGLRTSSGGGVGFLPATRDPAGATAGPGPTPFSEATGGVALPYITEPGDLLRQSAAAAALVAAQAAAQAATVHSDTY